MIFLKKHLFLISQRGEPSWKNNQIFQTDTLTSLACRSTGKMDPEIIIGIDPGTVVCGFGIIKLEDGALTPIDYGCIRPPPSFKLSDRYLIIYNGIQTLIEKFGPDVLVVETQYIHKNIQSAIKLGMARGTALLAAKK